MDWGLFFKVVLKFLKKRLSFQIVVFNSLYYFVMVIPSGGNLEVLFSNLMQCFTLCMCRKKDH